MLLESNSPDLCDWIARIRVGHQVLDLGCGDFSFAKRFVDNGAFVHCIDVDSEVPPPESVKFTRADLREVSALSGVVDVGRLSHIFIRNVLHFLTAAEVESLFARFLSSAPAGCLLYIESFSRDPLPSFDTTFCSYWAGENLAALVEGYAYIHAVGEREVVGKDFAGAVRTFFVSSIIAEIQ